ncbi:MAG: RNA polymerase sigma factor [Desulforhopalus sp.]
MDDYDSFYVNNRDSLFAYLLRMTGDYHLSWDLVQESFVRYLVRYKNRKNSKSLLYTIARNAAMDAFRKNKTISCDGDFYGAHKNTPEEQLVNRQAYNNLFAAFLKLPMSDRELLSLVAGADLSYHQIAEILSKSEANIKVKVHRARIRLKEILDAGGT